MCNIEACAGQEEYNVRSSWHSGECKSMHGIHRELKFQIRCTPHSLTIDLWITITLNHLCRNTDISSTDGPCQNTHISSTEGPFQIRCTPLFTDHRFLDHHYTKSPMLKYRLIQCRWPLSLSLSCCYYVIGPLVINHTSLEHHYTKSVSHIEECTYTRDRHPPQLTIHLWNTTTPNQCHI